MTCYKIAWISSIFHLYGLVIFRYSKLVFSADEMIIQNGKLDLSITKSCQFEATVFNQIVPSPSTTLTKAELL